MKVFLSIILLSSCVSPLNRNSVEEGRSLGSELGNNSSNSNDNLCNKIIHQLEEQFQKINPDNSNITCNRSFEEYGKKLEEIFKLVKLIDSFKKKQQNLNKIVAILSVNTEDTLKKSVSNINFLAKKFNDNLQKDYDICQDKIKTLKADKLKVTELDQYKEDETRVMGYNEFLRIILPHLSTLEVKIIPAKMNTK